MECSYIQYTCVTHSTSTSYVKNNQVLNMNRVVVRSTWTMTTKGIVETQSGSTSPRQGKIRKDTTVDGQETVFFSHDGQFRVQPHTTTSNMLLGWWNWLFKRNKTDYNVIFLFSASTAVCSFTSRSSYTTHNILSRVDSRFLNHIMQDQAVESYHTRSKP